MVTKAKSRTEEWAADPVAFYRDVLRVDNLYAKQVGVLEAVRDNPQVAICGANGTGKDYLSGRLIAWWLVTRHPAIIVALAPVARQAQIVWAELESAWIDAEQLLRVEAIAREYAGAKVLEEHVGVFREPRHQARDFGIG